MRHNAMAADTPARPTQEHGLKEGYTRRTLTMRKQDVADLQALALLDRRTLRETTDAAIQAYLDSRKRDVGKARKLQAGRTREST